MSGASAASAAASGAGGGGGGDVGVGGVPERFIPAPGETWQHKAASFADAGDRELCTLFLAFGAEPKGERAAVVRLYGPGFGEKGLGIAFSFPRDFPSDTMQVGVLREEGGAEEAVMQTIEDRLVEQSRMRPRLLLVWLEKHLPTILSTAHPASSSSTPVLALPGSSADAERSKLEWRVGRRDGASGDGGEGGGEAGGGGSGGGPEEEDDVGVEEGDGWVCPSCGAAVVGSGMHCPSCGFSLVELGGGAAVGKSAAVGEEDGGGEAGGGGGGSSDGGGGGGGGGGGEGGGDRHGGEGEMVHLETRGVQIEGSAEEDREILNVLSRVSKGDKPARGPIACSACTFINPMGLPGEPCTICGTPLPSVASGDGGEGGDETPASRAIGKVSHEIDKISARVLQVASHLRSLQLPVPQEHGREVGMEEIVLDEPTRDHIRRIATLCTAAQVALDQIEVQGDPIDRANRRTQTKRIDAAVHYLKQSSGIKLDI